MIKTKQSGLFAWATLLLMLLAAVWAFPADARAEDFSWSESAATQILLVDGATQITGGGAVAQGNIITIQQAGTYLLSGTLTNGQVCIAAGDQDTVRLVLRGVSITNETSAPIYASQADALVVILADGTENTLTDAEVYAYEADADEPDAALFSKNDLTIGGEGSLTVTGRFHNGIGTKDDLVIQGGTFTITAANDGLRGRDAVTVDGGTLTITAGGDGIQSNNPDADKGWVAIRGGTIAIEAGGDGIQAESNLTLDGGELSIVTGGGAASAPLRTGGGWGRTETSAADAADAVSQKGLKAGADLAVLGGTAQVDSADDSIHANGNVTISGGTLSLTTGDDGVHADGDLLITGGEITVPSSYEGLEGATVTISGGQVDVTASDDGINAAGGSDVESAGMFGRDAFRSGGNSAYFVEISGGNVTVSAEGDGIDSNGSLTFSGGVTVVHGPQSSGNGALDADGGIAVTGGTVLAAGAAMMPGLPGSGSTQPAIALYFSQSKPAGTVVTLKDASGTTLAEYTAAKPMQLLVFTAQGMKTGESYTIETDGATTVTVTPTQAGTTSISDTGEAVSGIGGGMGGVGVRPEGGGGRPR